MISDGFDRRTIVQVVGIASVSILVGCLDEPEDDDGGGQDHDDAGEDQDDDENDGGPGY